MRNFISIDLATDNDFKNKLLQWAQQFREVVFLDSNNSNEPYSDFDYLLAVDAFTSIQTDQHRAFLDLEEYYSQTKDWIFGYLTYDLKNDVEKLKSENTDELAFPDLFFFQPQKIFKIKGNVLELYYLNNCDDEWERDLKEIEQLILFDEIPTTTVNIEQRISEEEYLLKVSDMLKHIQSGDIYEANFCMEFFAQNALINPLQLYRQLDGISTPPFAVFFKNNKHYALGASPERYLKKVGTKIISQPIKGTAKRFADTVADQNARIALQSNLKERAENIMIVDLVRNDLSKTATKGSVKVEELCEIYTYKQVHQMISTVVSEVSVNTSPVAVIQSTYPMGSMTGAPKISAMKIIEALEESKRGLYSGAIGYFTPTGDFDFNVVIRTILYNEAKRYVSFSVGSAITALAEPQAEYEECLLKARAMRTVLQPERADK
ncbi:anthranilate synthase component I family protein [Flavobacterium sp. NKUCC04_CG]|uniref:anthranilate synthase component I family protein n=1 Tax=Flavobacterium sp. NKUCC04_CG TaxID=2842121 RepID=UPI001C5B3ECE|nr:anthranilate synthase component I family protein [Flavobacterium sp. NKUCC04_CG]MBW3519290.1 anthranilate synthase component I family protein [Flavobacterium sp. NKUCC04_CG]